MDKHELQKLRDLPIEGVAERLGLQVTRHKCLCPFHDDHHASLSFSVKRNTYRCFACGASGGTIDLAMKLLDKNFLDACRWLANENNIIVTEYKNSSISHQPSSISHPFDPTRYSRFFQHPFLLPEATKFLFDERMLDPRVVRWCHLTSWRDKQGVPWLQTPYYNRDGKLIGIQNRNLVKGAMPRFRFPQGAECNIYNLPVLNLLKPDETLFITEGCSDCWAMLSAGHKAIAIPSATLLKRRDTDLLSSLSSSLSLKFGMYPDNDTPGERLFLQLKEVLPNLVHYQLPPHTKDFSDYYVSSKKNPPNSLPISQKITNFV